MSGPAGADSTGSPVLANRWALACAFVLGVAIGCSGGGGGGAAPPTGPTGGTTFTADAPAGSNSVFLADGGAGTGTTFRLDVRVSNVSDLYAVAFDLSYPTAILQLTGAGVEGTFLGGGGGATTTTLNVVETPPGNVIVGISRLGNVGGANGSGLLLSLDFSVSASGQGQFRLLNGGAFGRGGTNKPNVDFIAGTIQTVR